MLVSTYDLDDISARMLIGLKLKGSAASWYHSKPEHVTMDFEQLLLQMKTMFDHRPSKLEFRKQFEQRKWRNNETFTEYFHYKVVLANRVPVEEEEMVDYIIDGISNIHLKNQARMLQVKDFIIGGI